MSSFIHGFVHKMTMREKVYFKRFAKLHSDKAEKNYLQIYEALEEMPVFEEEKLKSQFANQPIGKYLSSELNYLLGQILKSMANFHLDGTAERRLQKSILYIDILIEKGYRKQALKILYKAKKLAYRFEKFTTILKLIQLEEEILFKEGILGFTKDLANLQLERRKVTDQIRNYNQLRLIREQIRELQFSDGFISDVKKYPYFFENPLLDNQEEVLSVRAKEHWLYIKALKHYITRDFKASQKFDKALIDLFGANQHLFRKTKVLAMMSNYLYSSALVKDSDAFHEMLARLVTLEADPDLDKAYLTFVKYARTFELYYQMEDGEKTKELMKRAGPFMETNESKLAVTQSNYLYFLMVRATVFTRQYEHVLDWLHQWFQIGIMEHLIFYFRFCSLIVYYEFDLTDLLEGEIEASYKVLKRHKIYGDLAKVLLQFFKRCLRSPEKEVEWLQQLIAKLDLLFQEEDYSKYTVEFDYLKWAKQKLLSTL